MEAHIKTAVLFMELQYLKTGVKMNNLISTFYHGKLCFEITQDSTVKTREQDVIYSICKVQKIESISGYYKKYSLSNGCAVYVHSDSLVVIFCTDSGQYYFSPAPDKFYSKNN